MTHYKLYFGAYDGFKWSENTKNNHLIDITFESLNEEVVVLPNIPPVFLGEVEKQVLDFRNPLVA